MKWSDRLRFVRQNMAKNKSRIFMTVLAAAMGCSFLIMLASVAFGLQNSLIKEITEGQTLTRIELYDKQVGEERVQPDESDIGKLAALPHVRAVTPRGYAFARRGFSGWTPLEGRAFAPVYWTPGTHPELPGREPRMSLVFDSTGAATPATIVLLREGRRVRVDIDDGGEVKLDAHAR